MVIPFAPAYVPVLPPGLPVGRQSPVQLPCRLYGGLHPTVLPLQSLGALQLCTTASAASRPQGYRAQPLTTCQAVSQQQRPAPSQLLTTQPLKHADSVVADEHPDQPILAGGGGGIFFFWQLGVIEYLREHFDLSRVHMVGASAGALITTLAACNVDSDTAVETAYNIALQSKLFERKLGLLGIWGGLVRQWLDEVLPDDAAEICRDRLRIVVTDVLDRRQVYASNYASKADLIEACMASVHVPVFLDFKPMARFRGRWCIDGSFADFITFSNGDLLQCDGRAFILDYSQDEELQYSRLDFLKLRTYEDVVQLMRTGYAYAQRVDARKGFEPYFCSIRREQPMPRPRQLELV